MSKYANFDEEWEDLDHSNPDSIFATTAERASKAFHDKDLPLQIRMGNRLAAYNAQRDSILVAEGIPNDRP